MTYSAFDASIAAMDPLYNLPQDCDAPTLSTEAFEPLLEEWACIWMETEMEDVPAESLSACQPVQAMATEEFAPVVDLKEVDIISSSYMNTRTSQMDDAMSVVSVEDFEAQSPQVPQPKQLMKNSSFMNTCHDIDNFMASTVERSTE